MYPAQHAVNVVVDSGWSQMEQLPLHLHDLWMGHVDAMMRAGSCLSVCVPIVLIVCGYCFDLRYVSMYGVTALLPSLLRKVSDQNWSSVLYTVYIL